MTKRKNWIEHTPESDTETRHFSSYRFQQWKTLANQYVLQMQCQNTSKLTFRFIRAVWICSPLVSPAACFRAGTQLMDSSERQPLKWHYFRPVDKPCVAAAAAAEVNLICHWASAPRSAMLTRLAEWNLPWQQHMIDMSQPGNQAVCIQITQNLSSCSMHTTIWRPGGEGETEVGLVTAW